MDIKLAKTYIRKQVGGSVLTSILSTGRAFALTLGKTLGLSALAGLAGEGASQLVKEISGGNLMCDIVDAERTLASALKKISVLNALQTGSGVHMRPTKTQQGNSFRTILASLGVPLTIELVKK